jgi:hypothetical protein
MVAVATLASPAFANDAPPPSQLTLVDCEQRFAQQALTAIQQFQSSVALAPDLRTLVLSRLTRDLQDARTNFNGCVSVVVGG